MITDRDFAILLALVRYYVLSRQQVQRLVFPGDQNGRITRRRLGMLVEQRLINRQSIAATHPAHTPAPLYYPARRGCELLAEQFDDERYLATPTQPPLAHCALHWLAVSDTHIALDEAISRQDFVKLDGWISEWDTVNKEESSPEKRYRLYTLIQESPRLVCAPDAAFLLSIGGHSKIFYLEQDRNTSGVHQIAASKTGGYRAVFERKLHRRHFAATLDEFAVLMIAPTPRRRDALRKAIAQKPGTDLWRFAAVSDFTPDQVLCAPIWYSCGKIEPDPIVKRPENANVAVPLALPAAAPIEETAS